MNSGQYFASTRVWFSGQVETAGSWLYEYKGAKNTIAETNVSLPLINHCGKRQRNQIYQKVKDIVP